MNLMQSLRTLCLQQGKHKTFWIAYSGGMDSHVLLLLAAQLQREEGFLFSVIHINHQLSPNANVWAMHCRQVTQALSLPLIERTVQVSHLSDEGIEAAARKVRYAVFKEYMQENAVLLTAHHQDDQVETILLQLMRGAGVKGLSGMPVTKRLGSGIHARPFLSIPRATLHAFALQHHLKWIEDESNGNTRFSRNYLRAEILPRLRAHWPGVNNAIARSAQHCGEMQHLQEDLLQQLYQRMQSDDARALSVSRLLTLDAMQQRAVLRYWISQCGHCLPNEKKLLAIQNDVLLAATDRFPLVAWKETQVRRFRDRLYIMSPLAAHDAAQTYTWQAGVKTLTIPNVAYLTAIQPLSESLVVRFRSGGETLFIAQRGNLSLKNLFQEWQVPVWMRERLPLIFCGEKLIGVGGFHMPENLRCELVTYHTSEGWHDKLA